MDDFRCPTQLTHRLQYAATKENRALIVIGIFTAFIFVTLATGEVIIVVDEVYLHPCSRNRSHFDEERMVGIIDDEVCAAQANNFMQLITPLVNLSQLGHKRASLISVRLEILR